MFRKLFAFAVFPLLAASSFVSAAIEYEIQDIDTLQTHSSEAIALNNQGQILGWYNFDGSKKGKQFFVRDRDGSFHEIPSKWRGGKTIDWQYLTDDGKTYGFNTDDLYPVLFLWDQQGDIVNLGTLPGKEISAINNAGQVLIKSFKENQDGKLYCRPIIWENGKITTLKGLEGDLGIESEESYGFDMNNKGEVVGQSVVYLSYKNNIYEQVHAVKWVDGEAIDLHNTVTKRANTSATAINDLGEVLIEGFLIHEDGKLVNIGWGTNVKTTNTKYLYTDFRVGDKFASVITTVGNISAKLCYDCDSIWMACKKIISANDNGEIIAEGETIYGERHAMFLCPAGSD